MKDRVQLRNEYLDNLENSLSKMEGSFNFDIGSALGISMEEVYKDLDYWSKQTFIDTATEDEFVDRHALLFGVTRRLGTKAKGFVKVTGKANTEITAGTIFLNRDGIKYHSLRNEFLSPTGSADIEVECLVDGAKGNVAIGEINSFEIANSNIFTVINDVAFTNGYDKEPNSVLIERAKEKVRRPAHSGNIYDYEQWAKQVEGVGAVLVKPLWNGNGTVKILVANYNNDVADSSLLNKVRERIQKEDGRPIGADVTVDSFSANSIDLNIRVILKNGYSLIEVSDSIKSLMRAVIKTGLATFKKDNTTYLSVNRLEKSILDINGISDCFVMINGSKENILIADDEIIVVGSVDVNEQ